MSPKQPFLRLSTPRMRATFSPYGARLVALEILDGKGGFTDVVLGFAQESAYKEAEESYYGATVGRYANRIGRGRFTLSGQAYEVDCNLPPHHLHGGFSAWHDRSWALLEHTESHIRLGLTSPDGDGGFPGEVKASVTYLLKDSALDIRYEATTDAACPINLTHHSFFNLAGEGSGDISNHILHIPAGRYTLTDKDLLPTGKYASVAGTPLDFRSPKPIGADLRKPHPELLKAKGYDHNFVLKTHNSPDYLLAATVWEPRSRRRMDVYTNQPGMQFYTAGNLSGKDVGKSGRAYAPHTAFCLEPQHFPDSPNQPHFPSCTIAPGERYAYGCRYVFSQE